MPKEKITTKHKNHVKKKSEKEKEIQRANRKGGTIVKKTKLVFEKDNKNNVVRIWNPVLKKFLTGKEFDKEKEICESKFSKLNEFTKPKRKN